MKRSVPFMLAAMFVSMLASVKTVTAQYSIPSKMEWWYEGRFGMFIHFGSYSQLGHGEWAFSVENWTKSNYQNQVSANFNPTQFDASAIAELAKKAGMKYLVITAKHHEGFCMWQTAIQSFKDVTGTTLYDLPDFTAFKSRDVLRELKDACDAEGIKFCLYYSILDWNHSSQEINRTTYYSNMASFSARTDYILDMKAQLAELVTKYHPAILWFDGDWTYNSGTPTLSSWWTKNDGIDLYDYVMGLDSTLIVNERICRSFGIGDYECPEQEVPATPRGRQWETCQTMNTSWGYNISDSNYKSPKTLIQQLATVVSRDGNYLLNIGPKGDGTVPAQSIDILNNFGDWMNIYGESIYGTTRSPFATEPHWGVYTKKPGKLFVHVFTWPSDGLLRVPSMTNAINKIYLMNDSTAALNHTNLNGCITISLPADAPDAINSVVVLDASGVPAASNQYVKVDSITVTSAGGRKSISSNGDTLRMAASILPADAAIQSVTWSVSNAAVASIDPDGVLKAKKNGKISVIATANDGTDIQGMMSITVTGQTGIDGQSNRSLPNDPILGQNYPNPFNPKTMIRFEIPRESHVSLKIHDLLGREVVKLIDKTMKPGDYETTWDAGNLAGGIYLCRLRAGESVLTKKLILQK